MIGLPEIEKAIDTYLAEAADLKYVEDVGSCRDMAWFALQGIDTDALYKWAASSLQAAATTPDGPVAGLVASLLAAFANGWIAHRDLKEGS